MMAGQISTRRWFKIPWQFRCLICIGVFLGAFFTFENFRGAAAWARYQKVCYANGEWFDASGRHIVEKVGGRELQQEAIVQKYLNDGESSVFNLEVIDDFNQYLWLARGEYGMDVLGRRICRVYPLQNLFEGKDLSRSNGAKKWLSETDRWAKEILELEQALEKVGYINIDDRRSAKNDPRTLKTVVGFQTVQLFRAISFVELKEPESALQAILSLVELGYLLMQSPIEEDQMIGLTLVACTDQPIWEGLKFRVWEEKQLSILFGKLRIPENRDASYLKYLRQREVLLRRFSKWETVEQRRQYVQMKQYPGYLCCYDIHNPFALIGDGLLERLAFTFTPDGWFDLWKVKMCEQMRAGLLVDGAIKPRITDSIFLPYGVAYQDESLFPVQEVGNSVDLSQRLTADISLVKVAIALERFFSSSGKYPQSFRGIEA